MKIKDFAIERYFSEHEFTAKYLLSASDPDGFSLQYVLDLASQKEKESWANLRLGYTETRGAPALRKAIAGHYAAMTPDEVLVSSPGEANFCLMNVLLERGDEVICMTPAYQSLYQIAESIGARLSFWKPEESNGWYFDPAQLKELVSTRTKLIIVNFPHNPTGFSPSSEDWNEIINIARHRNVVLLSDEMYHGLIYDPKDQIPAACDLYENAVSLWGMAKSFGLAGLRLGWLSSKNAALLSRIEAFKDYLTICNSATSEILATIALNNSDHFIQANIRKIKTNIEAFKQFQERNPELLDFHIPKSGSTAFVRLKIPSPAFEYAERLVQKTGIMMLPSEKFDYGGQHARIGFGRQNLPEILKTWEQFHKTGG
ncbi:Aspartate/methionine/tyrosine aminotransferase [Chryseolinea serpens]|uniref:Aminotransferase n=1 Tax=Chryseolinea serpens TaxID=947013 RepID=A0A1M5XTW3_9BACT|nr:aminotransferase class I/II-fold pyridoxal phosphate-dependent enzyme [Chryseolinea serpens]SHI02984.1 Aspartate/methionine/tyrosine aminotransferase [Chryseolinea serpens]